MDHGLQLLTSRVALAELMEADDLLSAGKELARELGDHLLAGIVDMAACLDDSIANASDDAQVLDAAGGVAYDLQDYALAARIEHKAYLRANAAADDSERLNVLLQLKGKVSEAMSKEEHQ